MCVCADLHKALKHSNATCRATWRGRVRDVTQTSLKLKHSLLVYIGRVRGAESSHSAMLHTHVAAWLETPGQEMKTNGVTRYLSWSVEYKYFTLKVLHLCSRRISHSCPKSTAITDLPLHTLNGWRLYITPTLFAQ